MPSVRVWDGNCHTPLLCWKNEKVKWIFVSIAQYRPINFLYLFHISLPGYCELKGNVHHSWRARNVKCVANWYGKWDKVKFNSMEKLATWIYIFIFWFIWASIKNAQRSFRCQFLKEMFSTSSFLRRLQDAFYSKDLLKLKILCAEPICFFHSCDLNKNLVWMRIMCLLKSVCFTACFQEPSTKLTERWQLLD